MSQVCRHSCVWLRRGSLAAVLSLLSASAFAQTLAAGAGHMVILKADGTVWTVGFNDSGQLGDNSTCLIHRNSCRISSEN